MTVKLFIAERKPTRKHAMIKRKRNLCNTRGQKKALWLYARPNHDHVTKHMQQ